MLNVDKSAANIALVQNFYAMFGRGDISAIIESCTPDIMWESVGDRAQFPLLGQWPGRNGVGEFFSKLAELEEFSEFSPQQFYGSGGDKVFVFGHYAMTFKATGKQTAMDWIHVFTLRDGMCAGFREHTDTAKLVAAWAN